MDLRQGHWDPVIISALVWCVGFWAILRGGSIGASGWHPEAPLLYYQFFYSCSPWSLPRVGHGSGKRQSVTLVNHLDDGCNLGRRVRLTRKTRPAALVYHNPDAGHPTPRRWKRLRSLLRRRGGRGGRASQSFSSPCGWVRFGLGTPGTCLRREQA